MDVNIVHPTGPTTCDVTFHWWVEGHRLHDSKYIDHSIAASDVVQQEDIELCESVQRGLQSVGFRQGCYAPSLEGPMLRFHQLLHEFYAASGALEEVDGRTHSKALTGAL